MSKQAAKGIGAFKHFIGEVKLELTKCHWPTREELLASTWVVIFSCLLLSAFVGLSDFGLGKIVKWLVS